MEEKLVPMKDQSALVMGNGKVFKIQKIRQRKIHSCVPCHQRKVKCSREHPVCQNCTKNNLECGYFVNDRVSRGKKNKDSDKEAETKRKRELKEYIQRAKSLSAPSQSPEIAPKKMKLIEKKTANTPTQVTAEIYAPQDHLIEETHHSLESASSPDDSPKQKSLTFSDSDSISNESLSPPKLHNPQLLPTEKSLLGQDSQRQDIRHSYDSNNTAEARGVNNNNNNNNNNPSNNSNNGPTLFDQAQPLSNSILNDFSLRQTPQPPNLPPRYNDSFTFANGPSSSLNLSLPVILMPKQPEVLPNWKLEEIFSALPSKERSYGLVKRYRTTVHPILPLLDLNEFQQEHDAFWGNTHENKLEFLASLYSVLYAASKTECFEFSYDEITKFELSNEIHRYLRVARVVLQSINYPQNVSLKVLQSSVILHSCLENPPLIDIAILVRIAQASNLHRDPATYHNISDSSLVQLRRLLWWEIFYLDAMTSLKQMSTPLIRLDEFDTSLPVEYANGVLLPEICFLNGKFRYSLILNELTRFIYGIAILPFNTIQIMKQKILDLHISCNASIMNLENCEKSRSYEDRVFIDWAKSVLSTYCDRALLLLQKKIILSNVLNTNEDNNNQMFHSSYNQMINNKRSKFSIDALFRSNDSSFFTPESNLSHYSFDDLSNNLIPASLHYLYEFLKNNNDDIYNGFNWEIRNNLPFDAIILILTNLISDLEKNHINKAYELRNDIRYHLLDKSIDLIFIKFDNKKRSIIKNCFTLIRYLFQLLRLKYLRNDNNNTLIDFNPLYTDQIIPKPLNNRGESLLKRDNPQQYQNRQQNFPPLQTTSCAQIAPRSMRAVAGNTGSISFSNQQYNPMGSISVSDMFVNGLTSDVNLYSSSNNSSTTMLNQVGIDDSYKEHELQRIRSQISKFLREERLSDDDKFNNKFYILIESEVKELIERLI